jgi:ElaB/YqjD/DUF883 family membrane-anchored ribosome-binding protein
MEKPQNRFHQGGASMPAKATPFTDPSEDNTAVVTERTSDTVNQVKDKVSDLGRTAADRIDDSRDAAAVGLERAASALHEKAESLPGGEKVSDFAHTAADKLNSTADYVREHDVRRMIGDVETIVKKNPGPSLLIAAALGFLVARAFSRNDS